MGQDFFEKKLKDAKFFAIGLLVLSLIVLIISFFSNVHGIVFLILEILLLVVSIKGFSDEQLYGPIAGMVACILLLFTRNIIEIVFGILYFIDCFKLYKYMK